jgi:alpha-aminoadipate carrier protein LysW
MMSEISCMECGAVVLAGEDLIMGEILECSDCGVELEVVQLSPLTVELAPEIEEDWGE